MLQSVAEFERHNTRFSATTADNAKQLASAIYGYTVTGVPPANQNAPLVSGAAAKIQDIQLTVHRSNCQFEGTMQSGIDQFCVALPLVGLTTVIDPDHGPINARRDEARVYRRQPGTVVKASAELVVAFGLFIPAKLLEDRARNFFDNELNEPLYFKPTFPKSCREGKMILSAVNYLQTVLTLDPPVFSNPLGAAAVQEHLITTLFGNLRSNYDKDYSRMRDCAIPAMLKRAIEYMKAHASDPLTVEELSQAAGCSGRALQNACRTFRNTTLMGTLCEIRLERARDDLEAGTGTVAEIAKRWGFGNPGRFAARYFAKYGDHPSETLYHHGTKVRGRTIGK